MNSKGLLPLLCFLLALLGFSLKGQTATKDSISFNFQASAIPDEAAKAALLVQEINSERLGLPIKKRFMGELDQLLVEFDSLSSTTDFLMNANLPINFYSGIEQRWAAYTEGLQEVRTELQAIEDLLHQAEEEINERLTYWQAVRQ